MSAEPVIRIQNISKLYRVYTRRRLLITAFRSLGRTSHYRDIPAVQDISLDILPGEVVGIIGRNGSGKSTLLKLISGVTPATGGRIRSHGRITSLLELGVGFSEELTGHENIFLYASLLGIPRATVRNRLDDIIAFSGLNEFIHEPVKTYSSGMFIRLAVAVAVFSDPDLLLLDEILGVGDMAFQQQVYQYVHDAVQRGVSVLLVSHDLSVIGNFAHRVICLENGRIIRQGPPKPVIDWYSEHVITPNQLAELHLGRLRISIQRGSLHVVHADTPLTMAEGCHTLFHKSGRLFPSTGAFWDVVDSGPDHAVLRGRWQQWEVEQRWIIRKTSDNRFEWTVELSEGSSRFFDTFEVQIMTAAGYRTLLSPGHQKSVPPPQITSLHATPLFMRRDLQRFMGFCDAPGEPPIPGILVDFSGWPAMGNSQAYNGHSFFRGRIISRSIPCSHAGTIRMDCHVAPDADLLDYHRDHRDHYRLDAGGIHIAFEQDQLLVASEPAGAKAVLSAHAGPAPDRLEWELISARPDLHLRATDRHRPLVYSWRFTRDGPRIAWELDLEILDQLDTAEIICRLDPRTGPAPAHWLATGPAALPAGTVDHRVLSRTPVRGTHPGKLRIAAGWLGLAGGGHADHD